MPSRPLLVPVVARSVAALGLFACAQGGTEPNTVDISGRWTYVESFSDVTDAISCTDSGTYALTQTGTAFFGVYAQRGVCVTPQGRVDNSDSGAVTEGHLVGHTIRFLAPNCSYDGNVTGVAVDRIDGHVECRLSDGTQSLSFSGLWNATR